MAAGRETTSPPAADPTATPTRAIPLAGRTGLPLGRAVVDTGTDTHSGAGTGTGTGSGAAGYTLSIAPFTGAPLGRVPHCGPRDLDRVFSRARTVQRAWAETGVRGRAAVLLRFHDLLLRHRDDLLDLIQYEAGKARAHALEEVIDCALTTRHYARRAPALLRPRRRRGALPLLTHVVEHRRPRGVVGVLAPWNYPLTFAVCDTVPALLAGNAVVCKPDVQGAFTALRVRDLLHEAGLPHGLHQVVTGPGDEVGPAVVARSDHVTFTGSTTTGRSVAALAGEHLIDCTLELGGKNAFIVLDDADLDTAVRGAVRACFTGAGQLCMSAERVLVHADRSADFLRAFAAATRALRLGAAFDYRADIGSLASAARLRTVDEHVRDATGKGASLVTGGRPRPDVGPFFYEPTILTGVTDAMSMYGQEVFGPVAAVASFRDEQDAVEQANAGRFGLNASIWTSRPAAHGPWPPASGPVR
ncbi:succinic semialdehyde dehydrogenase [Streptomyces sp. MST-110588]|uniref:succinic semialdehyde dehydrogenase n=1 Tax=Streptomyces sp. MST-110588 TaxID=2833628 RepID=UPI0020557189|nr:aldehyde dehydrogenase family protein [Streptomyces sp. MST-110588]